MDKTAFPNVPNDERPVSRSSKARGELMDSLAADRDNAKYTQGVLNRDGTPTRPLTPSAASSSSAAPVSVPKSAAVPAAPQVQTSEIAAPAPSPVAVPVPAPVSTPAPVAAPAPQALAPASQPVVQAAAAPSPAPARAAGPETLQQVFARRLAEQQGALSSPQAVPVAAVAPAPAPMAQSLRPISDSGMVQLIPPGRSAQRVARSTSGVHALSEYLDGRGGASFRVGSVAFGEGTAELGGTERTRLRDLAGMLKKSSSVRVIGASSSTRLDVDPAANRAGNRELAAERADNVARELVRLGVPARKIYAGAASEAGRQTLASTGEDMTEIYIDY